MKTRKVVGIAMLGTAIVAGFALWRKGWFKSVFGGPLPLDYGDAAGQRSRAWMASVQSYQGNRDYDLTVDVVNQVTGASDANSRAFGGVMKRNRRADDAVYEQIGPYGIGRPE